MQSGIAKYTIAPREKIAIWTFSFFFPWSHLKDVYACDCSHLRGLVSAPQSSLRSLPRILKINIAPNTPTFDFIISFYFWAHFWFGPQFWWNWCLVTPVVSTLLIPLMCLDSKKEQPSLLIWHPTLKRVQEKINVN